LDTSFTCWFEAIRTLFCVFWSHHSFIAKDIAGVGHKESGDTKQLIYTLGGHFEHVPEICLSMMTHFAGKKQNFWSWDYSTQVPDYSD